MDKRILTNSECIDAIARLRDHLWEQAMDPNTCRVYGIPRGGIPVAYLFDLNAVTESPDQAQVFLDDIIDSGRTRMRYGAKYPGTPFLALADFLEEPKLPGQWLVFPWEMGDCDTSGDDIVVRLLQHIGEDPDRGGLKETPKRVLKAWKEWTSGYGVDPKSVLKVFEDGAERYDEMIVVKDIPFFSHCEHHLAPFFGTATIAYIPDQKIVGLSKLGRVLEIFARRLQVQERLTSQVAYAIQETLQPKGVGVLVKARHLCMESRGFSRQGHHTVTSCLLGAMFSDIRARQEFMALSK
jgi:GTP cyclohydrolase IA